MVKEYGGKSQARFSARGALIFFLIWTGIACLAGTEIPTTSGPSFSRPKAREKICRRTLTFAERVVYQYAIEEIYWRHRIWPKDNSDPKPPLDAVISPAEVERIVLNYLSKSQFVADQRGSPISADELQGEMERMAHHTKQPDVLRELFAALGNDPFVIAEILVRPILVGRLVSELNSFVNDIGSWRLIDSSARSAVAPNQIAYKLPEISVPNDCVDNTWTATSTINAPDAREYHTAVWTGNEMIIWGGSNSEGGHVNSLNTGFTYSPSTDSWMTTATTNAPLGRGGHTAVWTGSEMIVWGGANYPAGPLNTGGQFNLITDTWTATSAANAPAARHTHTAVWTGTEMIVWGGRDNARWFNTGARYDPTSDRWTVMSILNSPSARWSHRALWIGSEMIVWGGTDQTNYLNTGGRYNPSTNSWMPTSLANVPPGRVDHSAVSAGNEMIVWGGIDNSLNVMNTGGKYDPSNDSWAATSLGSAPLARSSHSAVWNGREMIVWGGYHYPPGNDLNSGGRYNPAGDSWTSTNTANVPLARQDHTAVWTGTEMIIWGGLSAETGFELNTGGRYCVQPSTPVVQSAVSRKRHGSTGTFDVDLPLSGTPGIECRSGSASGDYTIVVTFLANVSVNGNPQAAVTSGIGSIGSGGVSGGGMVTIAGNVVTIPLTNVANAQTINVTLNNVNGSTNVTIPMRMLIGDVNSNGSVNASDVASTKSRIGQPVNPTTFRADVNANGSINATDVSLVKSKVGTGLP